MIDYEKQILHIYFVFPHRLFFHNSLKLYYAKVKSVHLLFRYFSSSSISQYKLSVNQKIIFSSSASSIDNIRQSSPCFIPIKKHWLLPVLLFFRIISRIISFIICCYIIIFFINWFDQNTQ